MIDCFLYVLISFIVFISLYYLIFYGYDYYYYDNKSGKYKGFDKQGTKTETYNHKTKKSNEYKAT